MAGTHAKIGPSSLHRLLACPGSYRLALGTNQGAATRYAAHGTCAHSLAERCLRTKGDPGDFLGTVETHDGYEIEIDQEMVDGVQLYLDTVRPVFRNSTEFWIEETVDLAALWNGEPPEPVFGTADAIAWFDRERRLEVFDLKFGRIGVSPRENPQAMAYALGAAYKICSIVGVSEIGITIVQPRGPSAEPAVKRWEISGLDLLLWAEDTLRPGVAAMMDEDAKVVAGEHCRFCPAKARCPALRELVQTTTRTEFDPIPAEPLVMSDAELAEVLDRADVIAQWIEAVRGEASRRLDTGGRVPGYKLVPKRAMRRWKDPDMVEHWFQDEPNAWTRKIKSPAQIEKLFPEDYSGDFPALEVEKTSSGTTLVADHDPREALISRRAAADDFDALSMLAQLMAAE